MALRKTAGISRIPLVLGLALGLAFHVAPASALPVTLGFDGFGSLVCTSAIAATSGVPGGYGGLNWASVSGSFFEASSCEPVAADSPGDSECDTTSVQRARDNRCLQRSR